MGSFSECIKKCNEVLNRTMGTGLLQFYPEISELYGEKREAIEEYERLSEVRPKESEPLIFMIRHYFSLGDLARSKELGTGFCKMIQTTNRVYYSDPEYYILKVILRIL